MRWQDLDQKLADSGLRLFTDREFRAVTRLSRVAAKFQLIRCTRRGLLVRLKRGLYAVRARMPSTFLVANRLYRPSYISLATALSYHHLIPETVYAMTSVTTRSTREFEAAEIGYVYRAIKREAFAGYRAVEMDGQSVLMAEKEKALADYLYFVHLGKAAWNDRLDLEKVDRRRVLGLLRLFGRPALIEWFLHDLPRTDPRAVR